VEYADMTTMTVTEARAKLSEMLTRTVSTHERFAIRRGGRVVAALVPAEDLAALARSDADAMPADHPCPRCRGREFSVTTVEAMTATKARRGLKSYRDAAELLTAAGGR
jgi:prevent-host-death family protein